MTSSVFGSTPSNPSVPSVSRLSHWSSDQVNRLQHERRQLERNFAYHPHIHVVSTPDDPPADYEIDFQVRTLRISEAGELEYADSVKMRLWLPPSFPYAPPALLPLSPLFHPNISTEGVHLSMPWQASDSLTDYLQKVGELLAWRAYDPESVVNPEAMEWLEANAAVLPLDAQADFAANSGGEPLTRICQNGAMTIDDIHRELDGLSRHLLDPAAILSPLEVRDFSRRARLSLSVFLEPDVPQALREEARVLDEWARELPASVPAWEAIRRQQAAAAAVRETSATILNRRDPLLDQVLILESMAPAAIPTDVGGALATIPPRQALEDVRLKLPSLLREVEHLLQVLHAQTSALEHAHPPLSVREDSTLAHQLKTEREGAMNAAKAARGTAAQTMAAIESLMTRARAESASLKQIGEWREYLDLFATAGRLEEKVTAWGADGIHAFHVQNASGRFGPFQFDESIDLDAVRVAVRSTGRNRVRLINVLTTEIIGKSESGTLDIALGDAGSGTTTFTLTDRWEDLAVQMDFILRNAGQAVVRLTASFPQSNSWCGDLLAVLSQPEAVEAVREEYRVSSQHWRTLLQDLHALGPVKARLESWNFVQRISEAVPPCIQTLAEQRATLNKAVETLKSIVSRCGRDADTGTLVIPSKLAGPYSENIQLRDQTQREITRLEKLLVQLGSQVARQLSSKALIGRNNVPPLYVIPKFSDDLQSAIGGMADYALEQNVIQLEQLLKMPLRGDALKPSPTPQPHPTEAEAEAQEMAEENVEEIAGDESTEPEEEFATDSAEGES